MKSAVECILYPDGDKRATSFLSNETLLETLRDASRIRIVPGNTSLKHVADKLDLSQMTECTVGDVDAFKLVLQAYKTSPTRRSSVKWTLEPLQSLEQISQLVMFEGKVRQLDPFLVPCYVNMQPILGDNHLTLADGFPADFVNALYPLEVTELPSELTLVHRPGVEVVLEKALRELPGQGGVVRISSEFRLGYVSIFRDERSPLNFIQEPLQCSHTLELLGGLEQLSDVVCRRIAWGEKNECTGDFPLFRNVAVQSLFANKDAQTTALRLVNDESFPVDPTWIDTLRAYLDVEAVDPEELQGKPVRAKPAVAVPIQIIAPSDAVAYLVEESVHRTLDVFVAENDLVTERSDVQYEGVGIMVESLKGTTYLRLRANAANYGFWKPMGALFQTLTADVVVAFPYPKDLAAFQIFSHVRSNRASRLFARGLGVNVDAVAMELGMYRTLQDIFIRQEVVVEHRMRWASELIEAVEYAHSIGITDLALDPVDVFVLHKTQSIALCPMGQVSPIQCQSDYVKLARTLRHLLVGFMDLPPRAYFGDDILGWIHAVKAALSDKLAPTETDRVFEVMGEIYSDTTLTVNRVMPRGDSSLSRGTFLQFQFKEMKVMDRWEDVHLSPIVCRFEAFEMNLLTVEEPWRKSMLLNRALQTMDLSTLRLHVDRLLKGILLLVDACMQEGKMPVEALPLSTRDFVVNAHASSIALWNTSKLRPCTWDPHYVLLCKKARSDMFTKTVSEYLRLPDASRAQMIAGFEEVLGNLHVVALAWQ